MRYCRTCRRLTPGAPRFCDFCAASYNLRFCKRLHANPREAVVCQVCGRPDLSSPQRALTEPQAILRWLAFAVTGLILILLTLLYLIAFVRRLAIDPDSIPALAAGGLGLGLLWLALIELWQAVR